MIVMVVAATGTSKSESEPVVARVTAGYAIARRLCTFLLWISALMLKKPSRFD